jgi:hypothetical protein
MLYHLHTGHAITSTFSIRDSSLCSLASVVSVLETLITLRDYALETNEGEISIFS